MITGKGNSMKIKVSYTIEVDPKLVQFYINDLESGETVREFVKSYCEAVSNGRGITMTPSQQAKSLGHRTLADVARITEIKADTLRKYHSTKPVLFKVICLGALQIKGESNEDIN